MPQDRQPPLTDTDFSYIEMLLIAQDQGQPEMNQFNNVETCVDSHISLFGPWMETFIWELELSLANQSLQHRH